MVQPSYIRITTMLVLIAACCGAFTVTAQIGTQNLFRRSQYIEYLRLRNQSGFQINRMDPGRLMITDNRYPGQIVEFNVRCKTTPELHQAWLMSEVQFAFSRWEESAKVYSNIINSDSSFCDAYFRLAQCQVARNDLSAGYNTLVLARKKFPNDPLLNLGFGQLYIILSYPRTALFYFEKQIILYPKDPEGFLGASAAAAELNDLEKAILYLRKGRELLMDQIIAATGRLTPNSYIPGYATKNPLGATMDYLYIFESLLYNKLNQNEKSREAINHLTNGEEQEIAPLRDYVEGMYFYNKGEKFYNKAKRNIKRAAAHELYVDPAILQQLGIRSDPTDFKSMALRQNYSRLSTRTRSAKSRLLVKADTLFQNSQIEAAAGVYAQCIEQDSTNLVAFDRLAECYRQLQHQDDAVETYRIANRKFPHETKFTLLLARELMRIGQTDEAITTYRKVIELDKKNYYGYFGACLALAHKGEFENALNLWNSGKDFISQDKRESIFMTGILHYGLGYYHAAVSSLSNGYLGNDAVSKYYLSLSYHYLGGQEEQAASNMIDAIKLGAIVSKETVKLVGLDPAVHPSY